MTDYSCNSISKEESDEYETLLNDLPSIYYQAFYEEDLVTNSPAFKMMLYDFDYRVFQADCIDNAEVSLLCDDQGRIDMYVEYTYLCEDYLYDQTDVDEFKSANITFDDHFGMVIEPSRDRSLLDIIDEFIKKFKHHIECKVDDRLNEMIHHEEEYDKYREQGLY